MVWKTHEHERPNQTHMLHEDWCSFAPKCLKDEMRRWIFKNVW